MESFKVRARIKGTQIYADSFSVDPGEKAPPAYTGAGGGYRSAGWWPSSFGPNSALSFSLATLRNRALHADRNHPFAGGALDKIAAHTVGTGIKPQSQCPDLKVREAINSLFQDWTDESDADGIFDFYGQQWIAARSAAAQGEMFARFRVRRPGDMDTVPLQVQLLEADYVPLDWTRPADRPGNMIRDGIETNIVGKRVAYWMYRYHPGDTAVFNRPVDSQPIAVPASEVAHIYLPYRIGQMRGAPWLARGLAPIRDLADFTDATRVRQKTAALFMGVEEVPDGEEPDAGETVQGDENVITAEPGTVQRTRPGHKVTWNQPPEVGNTFEPFMKHGFREVAAGIGLLYEQLTGDYSALNDRTLRAALHEFRRVCHVWQHHMMVFQFCRQLWWRWLMLAEISGRIKRPAGMSDADFFRVRWVPEAWAYIHPVQDVQAKKDEVLAGFKSRSQVVSESGEDSEMVDRQQKADNARADAAGLKYSSDGRHAKPSSAATKAGMGHNGGPELDDDETRSEEEKADA